MVSCVEGRKLVKSGQERCDLKITGEAENLKWYIRIHFAKHATGSIL